MLYEAIQKGLEGARQEAYQEHLMLHAREIGEGTQEPFLFLAAFRDAAKRLFAAQP